MKSIGPLFLSLALALCAMAAENAHERGKRVVNEALQAVGGGTWGGCVYDPDAIIAVLGRSPMS